MHDEKELTEVLKSYQKKNIKNSENILEDLKSVLQDCKQKEFERIHFHFSGRYLENIRFDKIYTLIIYQVMGQTMLKFWLEKTMILTEMMMFWWLRLQQGSVFWALECLTPHPASTASRWSSTR